MLQRNSPSSALIWLILSATIILLDQFTKWLVMAELESYQVIPVISGVLNWTLAYNTGAAFSFLADQSGWQKWLFAVLAMAVSGVLTIWLYRTPRHEWRNALPFSLIIGGAIGNLIDRIRFGHVIDFIQVYYQEWFFPAFNVADSAITVGAILLIILGIKSRKRNFK